VTAIDPDLALDTTYADNARLRINIIIGVGERGQGNS
jgi:hypothetical protein